MYVDILILANLAERPQHGYEIKKSVEQVVGPEVSLNNGLLYPTLRRFEQMGAIEREVERQHGRPDRHVYHLTPLGREILHDLLCEFPPTLARNDTEFFVRIAFFDELEPPERLAVLAVRRDSLRQSLDHHERIRSTIAGERLPFPHYARQVMGFQERQIRAELEWVASLTAENAQDQRQQAHEKREVQP